MKKTNWGTQISFYGLKYHPLFPLKDDLSFKSILELYCPFQTEWRNFRPSELSTVLTEPKQELDEGPCGPPRHAFAQVRNLVFVGHHTRYVQVRPLRMSHKFFQERCSGTCSCRSEEKGKNHSQARGHEPFAFYWDPPFLLGGC